MYDCCSDACKQRNAILYGFGLMKEKHRAILRKMCRELTRLWQRKASHEFPNADGSYKLRRKLEPLQCADLARRFAFVPTSMPAVRYYLCARLQQQQRLRPGGGDGRAHRLVRRRHERFHRRVG